MKNRIEAHIKDYLHRYGKINLSGLGQFIVHNQQAEIVLADSKITPPTSILHFFPNIELDDNAFAKYLSIVEGTNEVVTADELNTYVRHIKDSLSKTNKSQITGIGTLYKDGDAIVFTPENEIFSDVHRHLKPYPIKPIMGKFISEYDLPQLSYHPEGTKPAWHYWIPFLLCLILSIFLIFNLDKCRESNSNGGAISMVVDTTDANAVNQVYNVACGEQTSLNELWDYITAITGSSLQAKHGPGRLGDVQHSLADISKIKQGLGFVPLVKIREGLEILAPEYAVMV